MHRAQYRRRRIVGIPAPLTRRLLELIELLGLAVAFLDDVALGKRKDGEEDRAERQAGDGRLILGKKIH